MILYANPAIGSQGVVSDLTTNNVPGYTASFDLLAGLGSTSAQQAIQFNNVSQAFRITDGNATDQIVSNSLFLVVERGNSVISHITTTDLKFEPWVGAGPQRGTSSAPSKPGQQPVFAAPAGLDWSHGTNLFVADRDNQSIAQLTYDATAAGVKVSPLVGLPRARSWRRRCRRC